MWAHTELQPEGVTQPQQEQVMQLRVLFTTTQGHKENIGFHHIYNSLTEVRANIHVSVCDSGCGPRKYLNAILLLEKYWETLISKEGNYYLLQDISPKQVPGTDILVKAPREAQSEGLYFLQPARAVMSLNSQYNLL